VRSATHILHEIDCEEERVGRVDVILPCESAADFQWNLRQLPTDPAHSVIVPYTDKPRALPRDVRSLRADQLTSGKTLMAVIEQCRTDFIVLVFPDQRIRLGSRALERLVDVALDTGAGLVYSDFYQETEKQIHEQFLIDYQAGALREDFEFGPLVLLSRKHLDQALTRFGPLDEGLWSGFYDLRLRVSVDSDIVRIPEVLCSKVGPQGQTQDERLFDYVRPENRQAQIEMERTATAHLKRIGAFLKPRFKKVRRHNMAKTASVIIPVKNREKTIGDAVRSALAQQTEFEFNVIVVDNHSTDRTSQILSDLAKRNHRIIHIED